MASVVEEREWLKWIVECLKFWKNLHLYILLLWDGTCWFLAESFDVRRRVFIIPACFNSLTLGLQWVSKTTIAIGLPPAHLKNGKWFIGTHHCVCVTAIRSGAAGAARTPIFVTKFFWIDWVSANFWFMMLSELVLCLISVCMYEDVARAAFWQLVKTQIFYALHGKCICALDLFTSWCFMSLTSLLMAAPPLRTPSQWLCVTSALYLHLLELILWSCPSHTSQTVATIPFYYHREWGVMGSWDH